MPTTSSLTDAVDSRLIVDSIARRLRVRRGEPVDHLHAARISRRARPSRSRSPTTSTRPRTADPSVQQHGARALGREHRGARARDTVAIVEDVQLAVDQDVRQRHGHRGRRRRRRSRSTVHERRRLGCRQRQPDRHGRSRLIVDSSRAGAFTCAAPSAVDRLHAAATSRRRDDVDHGHLPRRHRRPTARERHRTRRTPPPTRTRDADTDSVDDRRGRPAQRHEDVQQRHRRPRAALRRRSRSPSQRGRLATPTTSASPTRSTRA